MCVCVCALTSFFLEWLGLALPLLSPPLLQCLSSQCLHTAPALLHPVLDLQHGWTSLMYASDNGHADVVRLLLDAGASVDMADEVGKGSACRAWVGVWKE